ncbi:unnamed protein product [Vitrella brassicaformis CCMP3155]|uniref:lipoate--protein ligase n=2 Tax=Vitrella brassicaformis TaxID=1169539 RepID=A0A0G4F1T9_VITBC|nr:unnamed protein product [Vitrella brassicaformis CCMP3155]|mmetsp:Transcript_32690/g.80959  ORF Transcript_32690/g.80959 Transcript_32690/m.80959 type:complete len:370 (+) Transcript_32690:86-1195(+)|eukprot:CEM05712.1 unnamed protein product [Vitrella brassicaformis CCMP3155]
MILRRTATRLSARSAALRSARRCAASSTSAVGPVNVLLGRELSNHFHLATELFLIEERQPRQPTLFLWRNDKTIVIGRHQNVWRECDVQKMDRDGVQLSRRDSGGGAVYQDLGNTCFTFLSPGGTFDKARNNAIILNALKNRFGTQGEASGRNDLVVDGKKFSGAAFKQLGPVDLHHGTLLLHVDLDGLGRYLTPHKLKLQSKGVASVAARVCNLRDLNPEINHQTVCDALIAEFARSYGADPDSIQAEEVTSTSPLTQSQVFQKHLSRLQDWEWRFGSSPQFSHELETRFDWGTFTVHLDVKGGVVSQCRIFSDCLDAPLIDLLTTSLQGVKYDPSELYKAALKVADTDVRESWMKEFGSWIREQVAT